ncbi:MAG: Asp-tRNA(Asn)/Glu-tRNA(Gln) amidotransferase subunit GatC [Actinomycetota bacterium]
MSISREEVEHVARLARLALAGEEVELFQDQLSKILEHARRVTSLETEGVPATSQVITLSNVLRADVVVPPISRDDALANAPQTEADHFRVPKIKEGED